MNALIVAIFALVATALAAPLEPEIIPIVSQSLDGPNPDGSYSWSYETGNGIKAGEQGQLKNPGTEAEALSVQGSWSFTDKDGNPIAVTYTADENGFQPQSDILPTPPPIPAAILKALEWIAAHPEEDNLRK